MSAALCQPKITEVVTDHRGRSFATGARIIIPQDVGRLAQERDQKRRGDYQKLVRVVLMRELRKRLGQVATDKRLLNANGVTVILADALGPIPAGKQKRDAPLPQHVRNRKAQPTRKVDVQNREVKPAVLILVDGGEAEGPHRLGKGLGG